jgi:glycosyltransferase involved in cell wall biosynthesis
VASAPPPASAPASGPSSAGASSPDPRPPAARASFPRRAWLAAIRKLAIPLTLRSHVRNARGVAPVADLYHGMAYMGIPIALDLGRRAHAAVVYDARDIYLEARNLAMSSGLTRWLAARAERGWAARSGRVITVNDAYADVMAERLRVTRPLVVMNCSYRYTPAEPRERRFHERFGLDPAERIVLYHGGLFPHRGVEELMDALTKVEGTTLVLMGYGVLEPEFRERAGRVPYAGRIQLMNAVPPAELLDWVACADVVGMPIQASTLNHRLTTPNKLFEAMAAGVPSVVSDLPGMAAIVRETRCGTLVDPANVEEIAAAIRGIVGLSEADWQAWRRRCLDAAHDRYNWETQVGRLLDEYSRLTGKRW